MLSTQDSTTIGRPLITAGANEQAQVGGTHYRKPGITQQHWDYAWERGFDQFQYNITKRVERWREKAGLEDLIKARHELNKYIELIEAGSDPFTSS